MLEPFIEKYDKYLAYAYSICKCNDRKNDLVNDMFLKLNDILEDEPSKHITDGYIYTILRSIFLNQNRDNKEFTVDGYVFEVIEDTETLNRRIEMNEALNKLPFIDREILLKTSEMSLRKIGKEMGVNHLQLHYKRKEAIGKLKTILNGKTEGFEEQAKRAG